VCAESQGGLILCGTVIPSKSEACLKNPGLTLYSEMSTKDLMNRNQGKYLF